MSPHVMPPSHSPPRLCRYSGALGRPGQGFHRIRMPGTRSAMADYLGTVGLAWGLSAATGVRCSLWAIALFAAGEAMHWAFCVPVGGAEN